MKERIAEIISVEGITSTKFADIIGVQRSAISHILAGRNNPSFDLIQKILDKFPHVNADWLIMGRGEMYKSAVQKNLFNQFTDVNKNDIQFDNKHKDDNITKNSINIESIQTSALDRKIEQIVIFYHDKSFTVYKPT